MSAHPLEQALLHVLRELRTTRNMSQQDLADGSGLSRQYISLLERSQRMPRLDTLLSLCQGFGVSFSEFSSHIERMLHHYQKHRPASGESKITLHAADSKTVRWNTKLSPQRKKKAK
jgi:transcriptional regulator with XRE-family HTH domain